MNEYEKKIDEFFIKDLRLIKSPKIVEFGVRHGISTKRFIEICEKNDGFLHSVDNRLVVHFFSYFHNRGNPNQFPGRG